MEIELKYLASQETAEKIFDELGDRLTDEKHIPMEAVYYDTEDFQLRKVHVAVRVRREGEKMVATCKWGGGSKDGLHKREEVNVSLPIKDAPEQAYRDLFEGTPAYEVIGVDKPMVKLLEMRFDRTEYRLHGAHSISAISHDRGNIISGDKNIPISEMEIELLEGNLSEIEKIGENLAEKYELEPCNISKLARGLANCKE